MRIEDDLEIEPLFAMQDERIRLIGSSCRDCGGMAFPPRLVCLECGGRHTRAALRGDGVLHSFTTVENPPQGFDSAYGYGCIDLMEGPRILAALTSGPFRIGASVRAVEARVRDGLIAFRFEVVDA